MPPSPSRAGQAVSSLIAAQERYPSAGWYLRNAREAFRLTDAGGWFSMGRHEEYGEYGPEGDRYIRSWRREFLAALDRRINAKGGLPIATASWRKLDPDWQRHARVDADRINRAGTQRLRVAVTEITTDDWRQRFRHRLEET